MANVPIPNLPAAVSLTGSEQLEAVQAGMSVRITVAQIAASVPSIPPYQPSLRKVFAATTITTVDETLIFDCTSGSIAQELPTISSLNGIPKIYTLIKLDATANTLSIGIPDTATFFRTIDQGLVASASTITMQGGMLKVQADAIDNIWIVLF